MVFCSKCGTEYKKSKKFCPKCGAKFKEKPKTKVYLTSIGIILIVFIIAIIFISKSNIPQIVGLNEKLTNLGVNTENLGFFSNKGASSGSTLEETSYCGDGVCSEDESCKTCIKDCGDCRIIERKQESYCGDGTCDVGECGSRCTADCTVNDCQDGICDIGIGEACDNSQDCQCKPGTRCEQKRCINFCGNGICESNEKTCDANRCIEDCGVCKCEDLNGVICKNIQICSSGYFDSRTQDASTCCVGGVCEDNPLNYPVIFVHGHDEAFAGDTSNSINAFTNFQNSLSSSGLYIDKGTILPNSNIDELPEGSWSSDKPISVRTTYYRTISDGSLSYEEPISTYAKRLSKVVDIVRHHTGSGKVKIVAHSMGGLVTRQYIKFEGGWQYVDKVMVIGTPNHGIYGNINSFCGFTQPRPECDDMKAGSSFLVNLNSGDETFGSVTYATIAGKLNPDGKPEIIDPCGDGTPNHDETVCFSSVSLNGANNYFVWANRVEGVFTDLGVHSRLIDPSYVPEAFTITSDFLLKR